MLDLILIFGFASLFYYLGNNDYHNKGWMLAILSVILSFVGFSTGFSLIGALGTNLLLFLVLFIYNLCSKKPPGSQSGW
jgi:hypothetical protein